MAFTAVIFDIGGVLEKTPPTGWDRRWADRLKMTVSELERRLGTIWAAGEIGSITLDEAEREIAGALNLDESSLAAFMADLWTEYLGTLNEELARYFVSLRPLLRTAILSNSFVGAREREEQAYGFGDMCDVLVYSHEEGVRKPDPAFYGIVCDRLGVRPSQAIFLDDTVACVEGARRVGMTSVRFLDTGRAITALDGHLRAETLG